MTLSPYLSPEALETLSHPSQASAASAPAPAPSDANLSPEFWSFLAEISPHSFSPEKQVPQAQIVDASHLRSLAG